MIGIYGIKNKINNKLYIGLTTNIESRFIFHINRLKTNKHKNKHLQSAFNKYGLNSFEFYIIEECLETELSIKEKFYIAEYKTHNRKFGYNKTYGGEFGKVSDDINESRRQKLKLQTVSVEMRERISKTLTGHIQSKISVNKRALSIRKCDDITEKLIFDFYKLTNKNRREITQLFNLKITTIHSIIARYNKLLIINNLVMT